jgi:hypothetical protein
MAKNNGVRVRVTDEEKTLMLRVAQEQGVSFSAWVRTSLVATAVGSFRSGAQETGGKSPIASTGNDWRCERCKRVGKAYCPVCEKAVVLQHGRAHSTPAANS